MSCQHCVVRVKRALDAISGVLEADVSIGAAEVQYDNLKTTKEEIILAVEKAGYKVMTE